MKYCIILSIAFLSLISLGLTFKSDNPVKQEPIVIKWTSDLKGDFSFKDQWSYRESIYRNEFGQLDCDGLCPNEIDRMKDADGRIIEDSLTKFYALIDTAHLSHEIHCDAWAYEYAGTDFIKVSQVDKDVVRGITACNIATHSSLVIDIIGGKYCIPSISSLSVSSSGVKNYSNTGGYIKIDKELWDKGIMKAEFSFTFDNTDDPSRPMFWKGEIYTKISR